MPIVLSPPFAGSYQVTQPFGVREEVYRQFDLPGHEGEDHGLPEGTPVLAVDSGKVALLSTVGSYGNAIRLEHPWGESVYAHLSRFLVSKGATVARGQVIGLSGSTGNSTGPHLHFGLRVAPFFRDKRIDPWQGYRNPRRFFEQPPFPLGPHIINGSGSLIPTLRRWQPVVATVLDPDPGFMESFAAACPSTAVVGRIYRPDGEVSDRINRDPVAAAAWMDEIVRSHPLYGSGRIHYWQIANEVCQGPHWDEFVRLNTCMNSWMDKAGKDYNCALFAFGVGNPDAPVNNPNWWSHITPTLTRGRKRGDILAIHEYGYLPGLDGPLDAKGKKTDRWHVMRFVNQVKPYLRERQIGTIVTEFGLDPRLVGIKSGWKTSGLSALEYASLMILKAEEYENHRDQVVGACIFTFGSFPGSDWESYDINGEAVEHIVSVAERRLASAPVTTMPSQPSTTLAAAALAASRKEGRISIHPDAALLKKMAPWGSVAPKPVYIPVTNEFSFVHDGVQYIGQCAESPEGRRKRRIYYVPFGNWSAVSFVEEQ